MKRFWMIGLLGILFLAMAGSANAQAPMAGQPYAIPAGYEGYSAGTPITYGGYNYVIQDNGTMLLADSQTTRTRQRHASRFPGQQRTRQRHASR